MTDRMDAFNDRPELPDADAGLYEATMAEGCPADFPPAREVLEVAASAKAPSAGPRMQAKAKAKIEKARRPKFYTQAEVQAMPVTSYRVAGLIPRRGLGQIVGDSGCGKSHTLRALASRTVEGRDFCGRKTWPCAWYTFNLEGVGFFPKRLAADAKWRQDNGWPPQAGRLFYWLEPFSLMEKSQIASAVEAIKANGDEGCVIVIDTQAMATPGIDENGSQMTEMLANARGFARDVDGVLILVHHTGKDPSKGGRGHSSQRADFDFQFMVEKDGDTIIWRTTKERDESDNQAVRFKLVIYDHLVQDEEGEWQSSCTAVPETDLPEDERKTLKDVEKKAKGRKMSDRTRNALRVFDEAIHKHGKAGRMHESVFREAFFNKVPLDVSKAKDPNDTKRKAYYRELDKLMALKIIELDGEWLRYTPEYVDSEG